MTSDKHNAGPMLEAIANRVRDRLRRARKANRESLAELRETGADLAEAKAALKWREFIEWVRKEFDLGKSQALNLTKLHERWDEVSAALEAAEGRPDPLGVVGNVFTVENALKLADLRRMEAEGSAAPAHEGALPSRTKKETAAERLKRERDSAVAERNNVEEYAAMLEARLQESGVEPPPPEVVRAEVARKVRARADAAQIERGLAESSASHLAPVAPQRRKPRNKRRGSKRPEGKQRRMRQGRPKRPASSKPVRARKGAVPKRVGKKLKGPAVRKLLGRRLQARVARIVFGSKARPKFNKRSPRWPSAQSSSRTEAKTSASPGVDR